MCGVSLLVVFIFGNIFFLHAGDLSPGLFTRQLHIRPCRINLHISVLFSLKIFHRNWKTNGYSVDFPDLICYVYEVGTVS